MPTCDITSKQMDEPANYPLISIIVDNFNYARFLRQSIDSALAQAYPRTEVIVVDDASSDNSANIIRSYGDRVIAVLKEQNGGQAAAFNAGFAASSGEIVIFLDADDYLYPNAAVKAVAAFDPGVAIVQYRLHLVDADGQIIDVHPPSEVAFDTGNVVKKLLTTGRYEGNVTSGNAFSRAALAEVLPIPEERFRISADGYLVTVLPFHGNIAAVEEPLGAYRKHGASFWMSGQGTMAVRCRRSMAHDADKHSVLAECALKHGFAAQDELGLRDWQHLQVRIGSLTLDPKLHPNRSDTRLGLAMRGASSTLRSRLVWKRRAAIAAWFLALGVSPAYIAKHLYTWYTEPLSRPRLVRRAFKMLRRVSR